MSNLIGKVTPDGWTVVEAVRYPRDHTGANFSQCFYVTRGEEKAFIKTMDLECFATIDGLLLGLTEFRYETSLAKKSTAARMSRVVRLLESGEFPAEPGAGGAAVRSVPYLIFELGEGDIRPSVDVSKRVTNKWRFTVIHRTVAALLQLHQANIAHQDVKPSNVVRFRGDQLKIADLGRSTERGNVAPHDIRDVPGSAVYAPFELQYGYTLPEWIERRISTDVFHVGCLIVFTFTNVVLPGHVISRLAYAYHSQAWGDGYLGVIPHIRQALEISLSEIAPDFPDAYRTELVAMVRDLCDPDPTKRGTGTGTKSNAGTTLWLQKYLSRLDILEKKAGMEAAHSNV